MAKPKEQKKNRLSKSDQNRLAQFNSGYRAVGEPEASAADTQSRADHDKRWLLRGKLKLDQINWQARTVDELIALGRDLHTAFGRYPIDVDQYVERIHHPLLRKSMGMLAGMPGLWMHDSLIQKYTDAADRLLESGDLSIEDWQREVVAAVIARSVPRDGGGWFLETLGREAIRPSFLYPDSHEVFMRRQIQLPPPLLSSCFKPLKPREQKALEEFNRRATTVGATFLSPETYRIDGMTDYILSDYFHEVETRLDWRAESAEEIITFGYELFWILGQGGPRLVEVLSHQIKSPDLRRYVWLASISDDPAHIHGLVETHSKISDRLYRGGKLTLAQWKRICVMGVLAKTISDGGQTGGSFRRIAQEMLSLSPAPSKSRKEAA